MFCLSWQRDNTFQDAEADYEDLGKAGTGKHSRLLSKASKLPFGRLTSLLLAHRHTLLLVPSDTHLQWHDLLIPLDEIETVCGFDARG